ncbi:trypsin-like serine peptidase [Nonomuraea sp. NPDC049646]|uniref:trypsin-like serine peptidase n=1 Tax=unclassified Nonomuraea TaxID=2593643 RepID=UPI0037AD4057
MRRATIVSAAALSLLAPLVAAGPARAATVATVPLATVVDKAREVAGFWLADDAANLRAATPYTVLATAAGGERLSTGIVPDGPAIAVQPIGAENPPPGEEFATSGKVFFIGSDGRPHWCTGTSVQSKYRNLVATAGHCVFDIEAPMGALGKWVFVPAYTDGATPYGLYVGKQGITHYDFEDLHDFDRGYAFATVYNGVVLSAPDTLTTVARLGDSVGGLGIAANQPLPPAADVLGHPSGLHPDGTGPYTGQSLERSTGPVFAVKPAGLRADRPVGVDSPFTASPGAAWVTGYDAGTRAGYLSGLTISVADTDADGRYDTGISPYFDTGLFQVYQDAANRWTGSITYVSG